MKGQETLAVKRREELRSGQPLAMTTASLFFLAYELALSVHQQDKTLNDAYGQLSAEINKLSPLKKAALKEICGQSSIAEHLLGTAIFRTLGYNLKEEKPPKEPFFIVCMNKTCPTFNQRKPAGQKDGMLNCTSCSEKRFLASEQDFRCRNDNCPKVFVPIKESRCHHCGWTCRNKNGEGKINEK